MKQFKKLQDHIRIRALQAIEDLSPYVAISVDYDEEEDVHQSICVTNRELTAAEVEQFDGFETYYICDFSHGKHTYPKLIIAENVDNIQASNSGWVYFNT